MNIHLEMWLVSCPQMDGRVSICTALGCKCAKRCHSWMRS